MAIFPNGTNGVTLRQRGTTITIDLNADVFRAGEADRNAEARLKAVIDAELPRGFDFAMRITDRTGRHVAFNVAPTTGARLDTWWALTTPIPSR